jgi:hypothetical protein
LPDDGSRYTASSVKTPKGSTVATLVLKSGMDLTSSQRTQYNNEVKKAYPSATRIAEPTRKYNCHSYAWHSQSTSNGHWMVDPRKYWTDGSYTLKATSAYTNTMPAAGKIPGYKVVYYHPTDGYHHSAVVYSSTLLTSKWGQGGLYRHKPAESPYVGTTVLSYYKKT